MVVLILHIINLTFMTIQNITGTYQITGTNQDQDASPYKGLLTLVLDDNQRIRATWLINKTQEQYGNGFFKNDILVLNFNYKGYNNQIYNGVVVYQCISADFLEGFWSEDFGNPLYLGLERCFRLQPKTLIN